MHKEWVSDKVVGLALFLICLASAWYEYGFGAFVLCFLTTVGYFMLSKDRFKDDKTKDDKSDVCDYCKDFGARYVEAKSGHIICSKCGKH